MTTVDPARSLNKDASSARQPSMDVTLRAVGQLYTTVVNLTELVPEGFRLAEDADSEGYKSLVGGLVVASTALFGLPELPNMAQNAAVTMDEVRRRLTPSSSWTP